MRAAKALTAIALLTALLGSGCDASHGDSTHDHDADVTAVAVPGSDVEFTVPGTWRLHDLRGSGDVDDIPRTTVDDLRRHHAIGLAVDAAAPTDTGYRNRILLLDEKTNALPDAAGMAELARSHHASDIEVEEISTDVGDGYQVTFTEESGTRTLYGSWVYVVVDGEVLGVSAYTTDRAECHAIGDTVAASLTAN